MSVLITGGTGKTGSRVARLLGEQARVATRTPREAGQVRFDWDDAGSHEAALDGVRAVYLGAPANHTEPLAAMTPFLQLALERGVRRLVLLSASSLEKGGPMMGQVHSYLEQHAPEWVALRPTWFMQNFSEQQHLPTIRQEHAVFSATGDGRVPFIDAADIAAVAAVALTRADFPNGDCILTGPRAMSYDEAAKVLSEATGFEVVHRRLEESALADRYASFGMAQDYAAGLAAMDTAIAQGAEDRLTDEVLRITGRPPRDFADFCRQNKDVWLD